VNDVLVAIGGARNWKEYAKAKRMAAKLDVMAQMALVDSFVEAHQRLKAVA